MKALITGSSGHLGEALVRVLRSRGVEALGLDIRAGAGTAVTGSIVDPARVADCIAGVDVVYHSATLHKPHVATHPMQDFIDVNIRGTLNLLQAAAAAGVKAFVFTSTTSVFGDAMRPRQGEAAVWVTEDLTPVPKNIYGVTKMAAEELCRLWHRRSGLNCVVLRTSRFFPEADDDHRQRQSYTDANLKVNELLFRRADIEDVVSAHLAASERAADIGFGRYIVSATTPFQPRDLALLRADAAAVVRRYAPEYPDLYRALDWHMASAIERVYVNAAARRDLGWVPRHDFRSALQRLARGEDYRSPLARAVGAKGYHERRYTGDAPYPVE